MRNSTELDPTQRHSLKVTGNSEMDGFNNKPTNFQSFDEERVRNSVLTATAAEFRPSGSYLGEAQSSTGAVRKSYVAEPKANEEINNDSNSRQW